MPALDLSIETVAIQTASLWTNPDDEAKIERLNAAAAIGFEDFERGDYVGLRSADEIDAFMRHLGDLSLSDLESE